jgi:site-specific recombinase XerD
MNELIVVNPFDTTTWETFSTAPSPATTLAYTGDLRRFRAWLDASGLDVATITKAGLLAYMGTFSSARWAARNLTVLRHLFAHSKAAGFRADDPTSGVRTPRAEDRMADYLTDAEVKLLLAALDEAPNSLIVKRDRALISLALFTAFRQGELRSLTVGSIVEAAGGYEIAYTAKGGRSRQVPLPQPAVEALTAWVAASGERDSDSPLFIECRRVASLDGEVSYQPIGLSPLSDKAVARVLRAWLAKVGITRPMSAHSLRRTAITSALLGGAAMPFVQQMAGHASPNTTSRYFSAAVSHSTHPAHSMGYSS